MATTPANEVTIPQLVSAINQANQDYFDLVGKVNRLEMRMDNVFPIPTNLQIHKLSGTTAISLGVVAGAVATGALIVWLDKRIQTRKQ